MIVKRIKILKNHGGKAMTVKIDDLFAETKKVIAEYKEKADS